MNNTIATVILERIQNPCATLQVIGDKAGVTRERVRQILKEGELPTKAFYQHYLCLQCGQDLGTQKRLFCSWVCRSIYNMIPLRCSECDTVVYRPRQEAFHRLIRTRSGLIFCSKECQGKWLGKNHGRGRPKKLLT